MKGLDLKIKDGWNSWGMIPKVYSVADSFFCKISEREVFWQKASPVTVIHTVKDSFL